MLIEQIHNSIYRINTPYEGGAVVYLYLLKGDQVALVDTGTTSTPKQVLAPALAQIGLSLSDLDILLNTHGHLDHAGGNMGIKAMSKANVYIHAFDEPIACDLQYEMDFHCNPLKVLDFPEQFIKQRQEFITLTAGTKKADVDVRIADGDIVDLGRGIELRAIHVPGHTPGHLAFYWEDEGILFTGDAVQGQGFRPGGFPYYFDAINYRKSLNKMMELDIRILALGHAFIGGSPINDPTRTGEECRTLFQESIRVYDAFATAVERALRRLPEASKREIALAALDELLFSVPQLRLRETGMPISAGPTIQTHIEAAIAGSDV